MSSGHSGKCKMLNRNSIDQGMILKAKVKTEMRSVINTNNKWVTHRNNLQAWKIESCSLGLDSNDFSSVKPRIDQSGIINNCDNFYGDFETGDGYFAISINSQIHVKTRILLWQKENLPLAASRCSKLLLEQPTMAWKCQECCQDCQHSHLHCSAGCRDLSRCLICCWHCLPAAGMMWKMQDTLLHNFFCLLSINSC